jgi:thiol-disulfide isomerase/thioredoxin
MWRIAFLLFFNQSHEGLLPDGSWHAAVQLNDTLELPFTFTSDGKGITIRNAEEEIRVDEISRFGDSLFIRMPVFDSEFRCKRTGDRLEGRFFNRARKEKNIFPFYAERGLSYRFSDRPERTDKNITGRYKLIFDGEEEESKEAVGIFRQEGNRVTATMLTTTGDYRYLEGEVGGNRLWLSAFDGFHLFLFTAIIKDDSLLHGEFFSGKHWHDTWTGFKDEHATLLSPDSLTAMRSEEEKFDFTFPDENGNVVSLSDARYRDKAVIVQLMGTWCPNCLDESRFLSEWYNHRRDPRIEVVALDFERISDTATAYKNIRRLRNQIGITYPVLFAGSSDKKEAALAMPMLNRIFAYPTTIFLNKEKKVVRILTGFNGPATGEEYEKFKEEFVELVNLMVR